VGEAVWALLEVRPTDVIVFTAVALASRNVSTELPSSDSGCATPCFLRNQVFYGIV
jgi:hypothetical protein